MAADDWYRSRDWSAAAREQFEARLARSKRKAEYLSIKAGALLTTGEHAAIEAGRELLRRIVRDADSDARDVALAQQTLGVSYRSEDPARAEEHLRESVRIGATLAKRSYEEGLPETQLAMLLVAKGDRDALEEACGLLATIEHDIENETVFLPDDVFQHAVASARAWHARGDHARAAAFAKRACALVAEDGEGELDDTAPADLLEEMRALAGTDP